MQAYILIGVKRPKSGGKTVECLYAGLDGVALEVAAKKAAATKEYVEIGRLTNPSCSPMPIDPTPSTGTKPTFPRSKAAEIKQAEKNDLDKRQDEIRRQRSNRLAPKTAVPAAKVDDAQVHAESKQEQTGRYPGGASVEHLREDGPTLEEFVAKGYKAENYPPKGYAPKDTPAYDASRKATGAAKSVATTDPGANTEASGA
jgi:hypothetical protein